MLSTLICNRDFELNSVEMRMCFVITSSLTKTVYHLSSFEKFSEKFKEVKDAARLAREKSQDKELANTALTIAAPQVSSCKEKKKTAKVEQASAGNRQKV